MTRRFAAALAAGLALAAPAMAQDRMTLILDWFVNPDHAPIILAQELGYFTDAGLAVEIIAPADPTDPPKQVAAGRADLAVSYQPQLHLQVHEGMPVLRVGTLVSTPLNCLMVAAEGPVQSLADLKDRKIGYSVAGVEEAMAEAMLQSADLTLDDVEMINVNWSLTPALMTGQVDAVIGAFRNFELTQMRLAGGDGRCFFPEEAGNLAGMQAASDTVHALLHFEMAPHVEICAAEGISRDELEAAEEAPANMAYTRYVPEAGYSGDFLDLMAALAPCIMGYDEIGAPAA